MKHLNGHLMCAIDLETTGTIPGFHEIVQASFLMLDLKLEIATEYAPFDLLIKPQFPKRADHQAIFKIGTDKFAQALEVGYDCDVAFELWESWFKQLNLGEKRRITPLGYNYSNFDSVFLKEWMGQENYVYYIDSRIRDPYLVINFLNDKSYFHGEKVQFPNQSLRAVAERLGIEVDPARHHDALYDSMIAAKLYKRLLLEVMI